MSDVEVIDEVARLPLPGKVLWLGPALSAGRMSGNPAASPAALRWSAGFLSGLRGNGVEYVHIGHEPARVWPYGPMRVRPASARAADSSTSLGYTNLPRVRELTLSRSYDRAVTRAVKDCAPRLLVTYNAEYHFQRAARSAVRLGVPWIPILMDGDDRMFDTARPETWRWVQEAVSGASGVAFLSHWAFTHAPCSAKFHMDGGVDASRMLQDRGDAEAPVVLYTGTKGPWGGLDLLLDAWEKVRHPGASLWICGPGEHPRLRAVAAATDRIRDFGLVDESRLGQLVEQAAVLVNPRPPSFPSNRLNFPSKILEYLGTGKPIASTRTVSFGPGYDDVLLFASDESPGALAAVIDQALALSPAERQAHRERVRRFAAIHGDWTTVVGKFLAWAAAPAGSRMSAHG